MEAVRYDDTALSANECAQDETTTNMRYDSATRIATIAGMPSLLPAYLAAAAFLAGCVLLWRWIERRDPQEPPYVRSRIPFIGHVVGMIRYGAKYFHLVNEKTRYPIFALPMLNTRNYIVTDPTLAGHVQRNSKSLSFYLLIVEVTRRIIAFDKDAARITFEDMHREDGGPGGLMAEVHEMMNRHLGPGPGLDDMTRIQMGHVADSLNKMGGRTETSLYAWLRHMFSSSNMQAVYGPQNIFATHPELEEAFWQFEHGLLGLVIDVFPRVTAPKAYRARTKVLDGLAEFVRERKYKHASAMIRERIETNLNYGMSERTAGHGERVLMFGILGNAVPSLFWTIAIIFSKPDLLSQIRTEVQKAIGADEHTLSRDSGSHSIAVSSKHIQKACPLLYSCYRETLRYISLLTSPRLVVEDAMLGDKYLLRKGSILQIAGGVIHYDERIWGADAASFNPYRFLSSAGGSLEDAEAMQSRTALPLPKGVPSPAFRAFGGGNVLCPGRHFAQSEIMTTAAVVALSFDIQTSDGGTLPMPDKDDMRIPLGVMKPVVDPTVSITRRRGCEDVDWHIGV